MYNTLKLQTQASSDHIHTEVVAFGSLPYPRAQTDYSPAEVDDNTLSRHPDLPEEYNLRHCYYYYYYNHKVAGNFRGYCIHVALAEDSTLAGDNL